MGQTESLINIHKDDWSNVVLTTLLANFVLVVAHIPIWNSPRVLRKYSREKDFGRRCLLNPTVWYDGLLWWFILMFGAAWAIFRMLKILRISKSGEDTEKIYRAEVALFISGIQLGVHGFWAVPWFYWRQAFWSIVVMGVATIVAIGAYIPMIMVDPVTSGITYGIFILAQALFTLGNACLFIYSYDKEIDRVKNPFLLYMRQKFYPRQKKENRDKKSKSVNRKR